MRQYAREHVGLLLERRVSGVAQVVIHIAASTLGYHVHQPIRVANRDRPHQRAIEHAVDGSVGPDSQREGEDRDQGEPRLVDQGAQRVPNVLKQPRHAVPARGWTSLPLATPVPRGKVW